MKRPPVFRFILDRIDLFMKGYFRGLAKQEVVSAEHKKTPPSRGRVQCGSEEAKSGGSVSFEHKNSQSRNKEQNKAKKQKTGGWDSLFLLD